MDVVRVQVLWELRAEPGRLTWSQRERTVSVTRIEIGSPGTKIPFHGRHRAGISPLSQFLPQSLAGMTASCPSLAKIGIVGSEISCTGSTAGTFRKVLGTRVFDHRATSQAHSAGSLTQTHSTGM